MAELVTIAETALDCIAIQRWAKQKKRVVKIITLSLDAHLFAPKALYIWDILDMNALMSRAYSEAQAAGAAWEKGFSNRHDALYDAAARFQLAEECWYHCFVSRLVASGLVALFQENQWQYLVGPIKFRGIGSYTPEVQKTGKNNVLFKTIAAEVFSAAKIPVKYSSISTIWRLKFLPLQLWLEIGRRFIFDLAEYGYAILRGRKKVNAQMKKLSSVTTIFSGWGRDLSRVLDLGRLQALAKKSNKKILNLIWRPAKLSGFSVKSETDSFKFLFPHEDVRQGISYGPRLSAFNFKIFFELLRFFYATIRLRWLMLRQLATKEADAIFCFAAVRYNTQQLIYFSYRNIFLTQRVLDLILPKAKPSFYIGSDSGGASERSELLRAQAEKIKTLSVPHGYQAYAEEKYCYLADLVTTPALATAEILQSAGVKKECLSVIGMLHPRPAPKQLRKSIRVVLGVRSRRGLWSNYSSQHNLYHSELNFILSGLLVDPRYEVVIKSHPNGDYHEYYDALVAQYNNPRFRHISAKWKLEEFLEKTDVLVCLGEAPSFFISALYGNIPIVFVTKTMTEVLNNLHYNYRGVAALVTDTKEALFAIQMIVKDQEAYLKSIEQQANLQQKYDGGTEPEAKIMQILSGK